MSAADPSAPPPPPSPAGKERRRRRLEKRKHRLQEMQHLLYTKHFSNCRLPVVSVHSLSEQKLLELNRYESLTPPPSDRRPPLFVMPQQQDGGSPWAHLRLVACPCYGCSLTLDASGWLSHYLNQHFPDLGVPFLELQAQKTQRVSCHVSSLEYDVNTLLGVYGYRRSGLNPLNCPRNTQLPAAYRQFSQHGILMLFACRTQHAPLWQRKGLKLNDVLAIWVSTPLQGVSISLRCVVQAAKSTRYFAKPLKARPLKSGASTQSCREFIKTDSNVILISFEDLRQLMDLDVWQQMINVELKLTGEQKI